MSGPYSDETPDPYARVSSNPYSDFQRLYEGVDPYGITGLISENENYVPTGKKKTRKFVDVMITQTGLNFIGGLFAGGTYGAFMGYREMKDLPIAARKVRMNTVLNNVGRYGTKCANACAIITLVGGIMVPLTQIIRDDNHPFCWMPYHVLWGYAMGRAISFNELCLPYNRHIWTRTGMAMAVLGLTVYTYDTRGHVSLSDFGRFFIRFKQLYEDITDGGFKFRKEKDPYATDVVMDYKDEEILTKESVDFSSTEPISQDLSLDTSTTDWSGDYSGSDEVEDD